VDAGCAVVVGVLREVELSSWADLQRATRGALVSKSYSFIGESVRWWSMLTPWRPDMPQSGGLNRRYPFVVCPMTKLTSGLEASAPNVSRYEIGDSRPVIVTVIPEFEPLR
jgi:hypothetical protein